MNQNLSLGKSIMAPLINADYKTFVYELQKANNENDY